LTSELAKVSVRAVRARILTSVKEIDMARMMADCRTMPSDINCTLTIAGEPDEVVDAAVAHAVDKHGHQDTPEMRDMVRSSLTAAEPSMA
jgi:predicted small metal-binding protein